MSDYRRWTSEEEQYIRDHWKTQSDAEMAAALKRMEGAVRAKRRELRCSPQKTWTPEEERYLEDHWARCPSRHRQDAGADSIGDQGSG